MRMYAAGLVLLLGTLLGPQQYPGGATQFPTADPIAFPGGVTTFPGGSPDAISLWTFNDPDDLGADSIGSNDLTLVNTPTATGGALGYAADFENDTSQYAKIVDNSSFDPGADGRGFCLWVRPETLVSNDHFYSRWNGVAAQSDFYIYTTNTGVVTSSFVESDTTETAIGSGSAFLEVGTRTFVCSWWDGAGDDKVHLEINADANIKSSAGTFAAANNGTYDLRVNASSGLYSDMVIGPIYHYENGIPGAAIRASLYNSGKGKTCADLTAAEKVSMVSCWLMNEDGGPYVDSIGSNTLTAVNTPTRANGLVERSDSGMSVRTVTASSQALTSNAAALDSIFTGSGGVTVAYWFYQDSLDGTTSPFTADYSLHKFHFNQYSGGQVLLRYTGQDAAITAGTGNGAFTAGTWNLILGWWSGATEKCYIRINGEATVTSAGTTKVITDDAGDPLFRWVMDTPGGNLDNIAMWPRVLTDSERDALWDSGAGSFYAAFMDTTFSGPYFAWSQNPEIRRIYAYH